MGYSASAGEDEGADNLAELLRAIAARDLVAFRRFRRATIGKVMNIAFGVLRDHHAAEDVAQDVFLAVWKRAGTFAGERGGPISWLSAITKNRSLDYLRVPRARASHDTLDAISELRDPGPTPYDLAELENGRSVVRSRLNSLSGFDRDLLVTAIIDETPYPLLARARNLPLPTLKSQVRRALIKLSDDPSKEVSAVCLSGPLTA